MNHVARATAQIRTIEIGTTLRPLIFATYETAIAIVEAKTMGNP